MSSLYRKYRPSTFVEVVGQAHIVKTLSNAIKNNRIGHAYLLTGPRGTGKTTLARLFAKAINCQAPKHPEGQTASLEPCTRCDNCKLIQENRALDLIEIDAASHTGVDNIRQLKETVVLPPTALRYKIYIIDEVHMLSMGAFNALLKTLEEPPAHAIFILATTELHKIPETILSRCQRFDFGRFTQDQIMGRLRQIAASEKVKIDDEALETIALEAEGGMRDAESIFGQIIALEDKKITSEEVNQILGTSSKKLSMDFVAMLIGNNIQQALEEIEKIQADGVNLKNFNKNILAYLRNLMILKSNPNATHLVPTLTQEQARAAQALVEKISLNEILLLVELFQKSILGFKSATIPQLPLEMAVIEYHVTKNGPQANPGTETGISSGGSGSSGNGSIGGSGTGTRSGAFPPAPSHSPTPTQPARPASSSPTTYGHGNTSQPGQNPSRPESGEPASDGSATPQQSVTDQTASVPTQSPSQDDEIPDNNVDPNLPPANVSIGQIMDKWSQILEGVKPFNHSIHAFLKNCVPCGIVGNQLYIKTKYDFYKDKLNEMPNKLTVQGVIAKIIGGTIKVVVATEKECDQIDFGQEKPETQDRNVLHDAMQMLGGRIVDE